MIQLPTREYERLLSAGDDVRSSGAVRSKKVALRSPRRTTSEVSAERRTCCRLPWTDTLSGSLASSLPASWAGSHRGTLGATRSLSLTSLAACTRRPVDIGMLVGRLDSRCMPHSYMKPSHRPRRLTRTQKGSHPGTQAGLHAGTQAGWHAGTQAGSYAAACLCLHAAWQGLFLFAEMGLNYAKSNLDPRAQSLWI